MVAHGHCQCGCGEPTPLAKKTRHELGHVKGDPLPYIHGHNRRKSGTEYVEEDRGYETPCWIWQRAKHPRGYGTTTQNGKQVYAHRALWERANGPIPAGAELDHLCRVHECVRPDHMEPVTHKTNMERGRWPNGRGRRKLGVLRNRPS